MLVCEVNNGFAGIVAYSQNTCPCSSIEGLEEIIEDFKEKLFENEAHEDVQTLIDTNAEKIENVLAIVQSVLVSPSWPSVVTTTTTSTTRYAVATLREVKTPVRETPAGLSTVGTARTTGTWGESSRTAMDVPGRRRRESTSGSPTTSPGCMT